MGIAAPDPTSRLTVEDETSLTDLATMMENAGEVDLMLRMLRQFGAGDGGRPWEHRDVRELIERLGPEFAGVPSRAVFDRYFLPWPALRGRARWRSG
jgi:hypothetical protein